MIYVLQAIFTSTDTWIIQGVSFQFLTTKEIVWIKTGKTGHTFNPGGEI